MSIKDGNIEKTLNAYIKPVSKEHCKHLFLNESVFYKDGCAMCSKCCSYWDLIFLPFEVDNMKSILDLDTSISKEHLGNTVDNIKELYDSLYEVKVPFNGKDRVLYKSRLPYNIYHYEDRGDLKRCHWVVPIDDTRKGCAIHQVRALTCIFPHIRLNYNNSRKTTHIGLMQYGRNWALKCPVEFDKTFYPETVQNVINKFKLLQTYCDYFEEDNYCQKIIDTLSSVQTEKDIEKVCGFDLLHNENIRRLF